MISTTEAPAGPGRRGLLTLGLALGLALAFSAAAPAARAAEDAAAFIRELGDEVVHLLQTGELTGANRQEAIEEIIASATDVDLIGRLVLGPAWRNAGPEQREEYLALFRRYALRSLSDQLAGYEYDGETFEIARARAVTDTDSMVTTTIRGGGRPPLRVDWRVRAVEDGHLIVDVVVEGVSLLVSQRSEFAAVINRGGLEGLIGQLRERVGEA